MTGRLSVDKFRARIARHVSEAFTPDGRKRIAVFVLFVALFAAHLTLLRPLLQNGDSAVYNQQIEARDLSHRTTHVGYFALGILFDRLLPFGTDLNMNVMVLVVGFMGLGAVYATTRALSKSRVLALASVALALALASQLEGMLLSEVDGVSVAVVALAFACFQRGAAWVAGALFGFAVLVTPLSGPLLALFALTAGVRAIANSGALRREARQLLAFGLAALLVYLPPVLLLFQDYVHGPRGLLNAPRAALSVPQRALHSWHFVAHEWGYLLPLYAIGALVCLASPRVWRAGQPALALLVSLVLMAVVGERFLDVPVQLPNLVLCGMLPAIAFAVSGRVVRLALAIAFCACFWNVKVAYAQLLGELRSRERDREVCVAIRDQSVPRAPVLVGPSGWNQSKIFERFASSPDRSARVLEWRAFVRNQKRWLAPSEDVQIWFFPHVKPQQIGQLLKRYSLESRSIGTRSYQVLLPRSD